MSEKDDLNISTDEQAYIMPLESISINEGPTTIEQYRYVIERTRKMLCNLSVKLEESPVIIKGPKFIENRKKKHEHFIEHSIIMQWKLFFDSFIMLCNNNINDNFFLNVDESLGLFFSKANDIIQSFVNLMCKIIYPASVNCETHLQNYVSSTKSFLLSFSQNVEIIKKTDFFIYLYVFCINIDIDFDVYISSANTYEINRNRY